jgi:hypothetical protein
MWSCLIENPSFLEEKFSVDGKERRVGGKKMGSRVRGNDILWRSGNDRGDMNDIKGK